MLYSKIRFFLGFLFLILGGVVHFNVGIGSAWYLYLGGALILLTHFLFGSVYQALRLLQKGKIDEAEQLIHQVKRPEWLVKNHRAYYNFVVGMVALQKKQNSYAEQYLQKALNLGLRTKTDNALAALNISHIYFVKKEWKASEEFLKKTKSFESDDLMIQENAEKLEKALANRIK